MGEPSFGLCLAASSIAAQHLADCDLPDCSLKSLVVDFTAEGGAEVVGLQTDVPTPPGLDLAEPAAHHLPDCPATKATGTERPGASSEAPAPLDGPGSASADSTSEVAGGAAPFGGLAGGAAASPEPRACDGPARPLPREIENDG